MIGEYYLTKNNNLVIFDENKMIIDVLKIQENTKGLLKLTNAQNDLFVLKKE
jgi:hypothetical protein